MGPVDNKADPLKIYLVLHSLVYILENIVHTLEKKKGDELKRAISSSYTLGLLESGMKYIEMLPTYDELDKLTHTQHVGNKLLRALENCQSTISEKADKIQGQIEGLAPSEKITREGLKQLNLFLQRWEEEHKAKLKKKLPKPEQDH